MAYQKKTWKDRSTQYPNRIKVVNTHDDLDEELLFITRQDAEGTVTVAGDAFSAANMNDLENRVQAAFNEASGLLATLLGRIYPVGSIYFTMDSQCSESWLRNKFGQSTSWQSLGAAYPGRFLMPSNSAGNYVGNNSTIQSKGTSGSWNYHGIVNQAYADLHIHDHLYTEKTNFYQPSQNRPRYKWQDDWEEGPGHNYKFTVAGLEYNEYSASRTSSNAGGSPQQTHGHNFGSGGWVNGNISGTSINIDISQPYRTVFAWRRTQ